MKDMYKVITNNPLKYGKYGIAYMLEQNLLSIITHTDNDGNMSATLLADAILGEMGEQDTENSNMLELISSRVYNVDYSMDLRAMFLSQIKSGSSIFITDISISYINNIVFLSNLLNRKDITVTWIDHHVKSLEVLEQHPEFITLAKVNKHNIFVTDNSHGAGCTLTYKFLREVGCKLSLNDDEYWGSLVHYVEDWDIWSLKLPNVVQYKYCLESYPHCSEIEGLQDWYNIYKNKCDLEYDDLYIIEAGGAILDYKKNMYASKYAKCMYNTKINGHPCVAINTLDHESRVFGETLDPSIVYMVWHYNPTSDKYIYSIYTDNDSTINCNDIASSFGGGGHPHAAGFSSTEQLFKPLNNTSTLLEKYKECVLSIKENDAKLLLHHKACIIEECSEVIKEITKELRDKFDKEHLTEELADLRIITESAKTIYEISEKDIQDYMTQKLNRYLNDKNYKK